MAVARYAGIIQTLKAWDCPQGETLDSLALAQLVVPLAPRSRRSGIVLAMGENHRNANGVHDKDGGYKET